MQIKPLKIVILYLIVSIVWILAGSQIVKLLSSIFDSDQWKIEIAKGIFFVLFTAVLLYFAIKKEQNFILNSEKELRMELENNIRLIEKSLEEKQRLAEVIDRINNMVMITDPLGNVIWVNQAFTRITGYSLEEVVGRQPNFLHGPKTDPEVQGRIMDSIYQGNFNTFDVLNYNKTGQEYWVEISISAIYNKKNEVIRYISVENVITERKLRDEMIRQQNHMLKKLAWTNSHAIRKPVVSILSLVELSEDAKNLEEIKELHTLIARCAKDLDHIIREAAKTNL